MSEDDSAKIQAAIDKAAKQLRVIYLPPSGTYALDSTGHTIPVGDTPHGRWRIDLDTGEWTWEDGWKSSE